MGYTTDFKGKFNLDRPLSAEHKMYLCEFARTRRMQRDAAVTATREDPVRIAAQLHVGEEGGYFVGEGGFAGQVEHQPHQFPQRGGYDHHLCSLGILDYNRPPAGQPELWCQWVPSEDGTSIEWNGVEKFYEYVEWLEYLIEHFLKTWGYVLNGRVSWQGEDTDDRGVIHVRNNEIRAVKSEIVEPDPNFEEDP